MGLIRASDGAVAATYDYPPFGRTTANETYVQNRFRFASGEFVDAG